MTINLDKPELRTQYERERKDAYIRSMRVLRQYAKNNGFEGRLNQILKSVGGNALLNMNYSSRTTSNRERARQKMMLPKLKRALNQAERQLRQEIAAAHKGYKPITDTIKYKYKSTDGVTKDFELDPDMRAHRILQDFEAAITDMPYADAIRNEFMPTFRQIRREMVSKWGWDKKESSAQATLLTIKTIADKWMSAR